MHLSRPVSTVAVAAAFLGLALAPAVSGEPVEPDPVWSTYLGGSSSEEGHAVAVGPAGSVFVAGRTSSDDFPEADGSRGGSDAFVARMGGDGSRLTYGVVLGGSGYDRAWGVHPLPDGDVLVVGQTGSADFPTTRGAHDRTHGGGSDAFVARLQAGGSIDWSTFLGGSGFDKAIGVAVAADGDILVAGSTSSCDFPTTPNAVRTRGEGCNPYETDVFVTRLEAGGGDIVASTLFGGAGDDDAEGFALGPGDDVYVVGRTASDGIATAGAYDTTRADTRDAFVARLDDELDRVEWATYLGGSSGDHAAAVAVEPDGDALVTGSTFSVDFPTTAGALHEAHQSPAHCEGYPYDDEMVPCSDAFVTEVSTDGEFLKFSTFLGGTGDDEGHGIGIDDAGRPFVVGESQSDDFPSAADGRDRGYYHAFYVVLTNDGNHLLAEKALFGSGWDRAHAVALRKGNAYVVGQTSSSDYPTTVGAFDRTRTGWRDAFVTVFSQDELGAPGARPAVFDHRGGNDWWVEVDVDPHPTRVQARDTGGPWQDLEFRSWGNWAGSFRIEAGHDVQFRAWIDGAWVESCWHVHPAGDVSTCGGGAFSFDHHGGNEWWVQTGVTPRPAEVQARDTGGVWKPLEHKSWGDWAGSFHVEPGHDVQFRARDTGGDWIESCWFTHPQGGLVTCDAGDDGGFDATFRNVRGNEWWLETDVAANEPVASVDARIDGGVWKPLEKRDRGSWAASRHAPEGSVVEFRAVSADGGTDTSAAYAWPP